MRTTPTAACKIDIEPLKLRRNRATIAAVERYKRLEDNHPNKLLTERNRKQTKRKQRTLLQIADELSKNHHLPNNREKISRATSYIPGQNFRLPIIRTQLNDKNISKESSPLILKSATLETIESYPKTALTDQLSRPP